MQITVNELAELLNIDKSMASSFLKVGVALGKVVELGLIPNPSGKGKSVMSYEVPKVFTVDIVPDLVATNCIEGQAVNLPAEASASENVSDNTPFNVDSTPKNFVLRCVKCRWARMSTGLTEDLKDLRETTGCNNCGKVRQFRCPKCGQTAKLNRIRNNS